MTRFLIHSVIFSVLLTSILLFLLLQYLHSMTESKLPSANISHEALAAKDQDMVIHFINLDIGKATLIQMGEQGVLMDVGHQKDTPALLEYLKKCGITMISRIFLSNPRIENTGGLQKIIQEYPLAKIYVPALTQNQYDIPEKSYLVLSVNEGDAI